MPPAQESVAPAVWRATTFRFDTAQDYADVLGDRRPGYTYSRVDNPTADDFAQALAALEGFGLEGVVRGQAFASGMAAISTTMLALTASGAHVVAAHALYGGTFGLIEHVLSRFGVSVSYADAADPESVRAALRPETALVWAETLANPTMAVADIPGLAAVSRAAGIPLVVDSTFASPAICRPLALGADVVVHSATKYIGGHSDVTGGAAVGRPDLMARIRLARVDLGGSLAPDDAYLLRRGLQTLALRVQRHCQVALAVAQALDGHPMLEQVAYPGLPSHPHHELARRLFEPGRFGGVVTITPVGGYDAGLAFCDRLQLISVAASLGGTHSLASHVASTTHRQLSPADLARAGIGPAAVRISCGLEDPADLMEDITSSLARLG